MHLREIITKFHIFLKLHFSGSLLLLNSSLLGSIFKNTKFIVVSAYIPFTLFHSFQGSLIQLISFLCPSNIPY